MWGQHNTDSGVIVIKTYSFLKCLRIILIVCHFSFSLLQDGEDFFGL